MPESTISVTELDFDDIKQSLKGYISGKPEFLDYNFEGSTISLLLDILAYNTYQNAYYTSMVGNEMFLDSAQLRDSVVSRAKAIGYTPRSARGASTTLDVSVTPVGSPASITIAKNTEWSATVDGIIYKFVTPKEYTFSSADNYTGTISIVEGRPLTNRWTVDTSNPVRYVLPNENVDTTSIVVTIQESAVDTSSTTYTLANDITEVTSTSPIYFLQETEDSQFEIYFGDNVLGKSPTNGNIVIVSYRVCNGVDGNDISTFTNPSTIGGESTFSVLVNSSTSGGSSIESVSSIQFNAPKNFETQNRAVLAGDYKQIILNNNGDIESVSVWGGEENTPAIYGKVFISIKPIGGTIISSDRKDAIKTQLKKYNVLSIDPEFVNATYLYIRPTTTVNMDSSLTTLSATAVQTKVVNAIEQFEDDNLGVFEKPTFRYSKFSSAIDNADNSIKSNNTTIVMEKRFNPSVTAASTYNISFNNAINNPHTGHRFAISSSTFTYQGKTCYLDDDGNGNIRIYYIQLPNTTIYLDETAGTVNYKTGLVTLNSFAPTAYSGSYLSIFADPADNNIKAIRNQIILIANARVTVVDDATTVVTAQTVTATTSGVTTNVIDSGLYPVVY
jgi:hypothetical protein